MAIEVSELVSTVAIDTPTENPVRTRVFYDSEFSGLHQSTTLISIGFVAENGQTFYGIFNDYNRDDINWWLQTNVLDHLTDGVVSDEDNQVWIGDRNSIMRNFLTWIRQFEQVEVWSDCLAYDWVLFCQMFKDTKTSMSFPRNVLYIPFDICTLMRVKGVDPDISREAFAGIDGTKHNALHDAKVIKACYDKLMEMPWISI